MNSSSCCAVRCTWRRVSKPRTPACILMAAFSCVNTCATGFCSTLLMKALHVMHGCNLTGQVVKCNGTFARAAAGCCMLLQLWVKYRRDRRLVDLRLHRSKISTFETTGHRLQQTVLGSIRSRGVCSLVCWQCRQAARCEGVRCQSEPVCPPAVAAA